MLAYKICLVGGWCGNRMVIIADYLGELLRQSGLPCRIVTHSVWENYSLPPPADLVLQLLPAFTEAETGCPVINIKPLLLDHDHPATIEKILQRVRADYPAAMDLLPVFDAA